MFGSGWLSKTNRALAAVLSFILIAIAILVRILYPQVLENVGYFSQTALQLAWPNTTSGAPVYTIYLSPESADPAQEPVYQRLQLAQILQKLGEHNPKLLIIDADLRKADLASPTLRSRIYDTLQPSLRATYPNHDLLLQTIISHYPVILNRPEAEAVAKKPPLSNYLRFSQAVGYQSNDDYVHGSSALLYPLQFKGKTEHHASLALQAWKQANPSAAQQFQLTKTAQGYQLESPSLDIPVSANSEMMIFNPRAASDYILSAEQILTDSATLKNWPPAEGSIFVIGTQSRSSQRHAQALHTLHTGNFVAIPSWAQYAEIAALFLFGGVIAVISARQSFRTALTLTLLALFTINAAAFHQFALENRLLEPFYPSLIILLIFTLSSTIRRVTFKSHRTQTTERFTGILSPKQMQRLLSNADPLPLEGQQREITSLSTHIRHFHRYYEGLSPQDLAGFSNGFQSAHLDEVHVHDGTLNTMGTAGLSAYWNAPLDDPFHASHACRTAFEMLKQMKRFNLKDRFNFNHKNMKDHAVTLDIGIATGLATLGETGTRRHFRYAPLGKCVDLADDLARHCKEAGHNLLICETTRGQMQELAMLETIPVKTSRYEMRSFALLGDPSLAFSESFLKLKNTHCSMVYALFEENDKKKALTLMDECKSLSEGEYHSIYAAFEKYIFSDLAEHEAIKDAAQ
ncbi:adenylate/guanylate cyclase domain-containing protein [Pseudovibrio japonicus]|uniref:Adenylate/guanylate cyclase domain-containing protein n=1 Tax=Pseudovibrio japonicus TaxID=366534 RepID=A0ABQ3ENC4_9HYPH|nr:adenylate/guanylate cyclase domain-containing protein [Pseudovibrio japonicus]GHB39350.1 adenylate/guanylate cyclase domain-containing protein [Pseudovibrio japonicus]